jgi:5-methylcytosine-specific restriction endonuclease McrBC GTP-binding regulatory subunit McrB
LVVPRLKNKKRQSKVKQREIQRASNGIQIIEWTGGAAMGRRKKVKNGGSPNIITEAGDLGWAGL